MRKLCERDIERRLVKRAKELGGECRKVRWIGRGGAPDRLVMIPARAIPVPAPEGHARRATDYAVHIPAKTIWVEVKAPGLARTFPKGGHERAQAREHIRMRKMGQRVEVIDSFERIEEILK